jgi:hypothetical protein
MQLLLRNKHDWSSARRCSHLTHNHKRLCFSTAFCLSALCTYVLQLQAAQKADDQPSSSSAAAGAQRPTVQLTIQSAEQLPAAEAVIAAMYGVPDAIKGLEQHQAVHAVVIADMVHAGAAGQQALQVLQAAAASDEGLAEAALQALAGLSVWPSCLLQLMPSIMKHAACCRDSTADTAAVAASDAGSRVQQLLVAAFGDLQAVWSDSQQQQLLLGLPLPAMQLLLSSDSLRVPSEDTVLFTATKYVRAQGKRPAKKAAKAALAQLVRAPQLSLFSLSCQMMPAGNDQQLLTAYAAKLTSLLLLKRNASEHELAGYLDEFGVIPASWRLGPRQLMPLADGVHLEWRVPVQQLKQTCRDSFEKQESKWLYSHNSPPYGGVAWRMQIECGFRDGGVNAVLDVGPVPGEVPAGIYFKFRATFSWNGVQRLFRSPCLSARGEVFWDDLFEVPPMAGGWDEAAWEAAGLPAAGQTVLKLHLYSLE